MINDWIADGRVHVVYRVSCYEQALKHLPQDLEDYSSLREEIELARAAAARGEDPSGGSSDGGSDGGSTSGGGGGGDDGDDRVSPTPPLSGESTDERDKGFMKRFLVAVGPKNADEVPVPLLVLGAIATLLMAAGAAGMVARRSSRTPGDEPPPAQP